MKTITILLVLFSNLFLAQTTVIEYLYADKIPGSFEKNREFLIYDDEASFYYTDVDQQKGTPKDVIANFKMTRGAKAYIKTGSTQQSLYNRNVCRLRIPIVFGGG